MCIRDSSHLLLGASDCEEPVRHLFGLREEVLVTTAIDLAEAVLSVVVQQLRVYLGGLTLEGGL